MSITDETVNVTVEILTKVDTLNRRGKACVAEPLRPRIQALVNVGLLTATSMRCGPLGLPANEAWLRLTEDGRKLLQPNG